MKSSLDGAAQHLLVVLTMMASSSAGDDKDCFGEYILVLRRCPEYNKRSKGGQVEIAPLPGKLAAEALRYDVRCKS